jgi:carotenoid cleavage dioxygenase
MAAATNVYLEGNFAPVREELDLPCPEVEGSLPKDLAGFFLRNGPNADLPPLDLTMYHPFDGDGMIHEMEFRDGRASYRNRWIATKGLERERKAGKALWGGFASIGKSEPPADMPFKNLANTALCWQAGKLLATWEAGSPYVVRLPDLETVGETDFDGGWPHAVSAHPKVDPRTGELILFCYSPIEQPYVRYGVADKNGKVVHQTGIHLAGQPVMIHDMAITDRHSIIFDMPVTFSLERIMNGGPAFGWEPSNGTRIGVLPRYGDGADIQWFDVQTGYVFHAFNAWEEGDEIVLDACLSPSTSILAETDVPIDVERARMHRYRLNLTTGKVTEGRVSDIPLEFARVNETLVGTKTRYGYASRFADDPINLRFSAVLKHDREGDRIEAIELPEKVFTQEFVFAPKVGSRSEDDGYVVGFVYDENRQASEAWVIDAQDFGKGPIAKVHIPARVPYGFHSHWVSAEDAKNQRV